MVMQSSEYTRQQLDLLRLSLCEGLGPRRHQVLLDRFATVEAVLAAGPDALLEVPGIGRINASRIARANQHNTDALLQQCRENNIWLWFRDSTDFPDLLSEIPDPPLVLYGQGTWQPGDRYGVAIVGTRKPTAYGRRQASRLAASLVEAGLTVVSGLARGIDTEAHQAALDAGGRTVAVLGSGILKLYPRENQRLADRVITQGVLLSECPPTRQPMSGAFPQRNRVISGLSCGVVVVEAGFKSGALITARHALEQGREVFAVPGPIDSPNSRGCHGLLRDGAKLVESADDILEELMPLLSVAASDRAGSAATGGNAAALPAHLVDQLPAEMATVFGEIGHTLCSVEQLAATLRLPMSSVLSILTQLELKRLIHREGPLHVRRRF